MGGTALLYRSGDLRHWEYLHPLHVGDVHRTEPFWTPQSFRDDTGRRVMFGWLREERQRDAVVAAGWAGTMSLPRVLTARADGTLMQRPAPELQSLRGAHVHHDDIATMGEVQDVLGGLLVDRTRSRADSVGVVLVVEGGRAIARSLDFWELASVW